jgi:hypothetical protein
LSNIPSRGRPNQAKSNALTANDILAKDRSIIVEFSCRRS